ncbi:hypothetical protein ACFYO1_12190 [Nocardia sp. NPDC006044]|uniref:hypothetical protein n=1 Tax=Nocardia sp. NPDC006044 TaxID=3364306 RepID=UPI0036C8558C
MASQAAVLVPVLYYFGAVYASAWYGYFGIDSKTLGYSVSDFVRRSMAPTFWPVILGMVGLLVLLAARHVPMMIARRTHNELRALRIWYVLMSGSGVVLLAVAPLIRVFGVPPWFPLNNYLMPGSIVAGSILLGYATTLRSDRPDLWRTRQPQRGRLRPRRRESPQSSAVVVMIALFTLGLAGAIWIVGNFAAEKGLDDARNLAENRFPNVPSTVVWSVEGLGLLGPDVEATPVDIPGEKYRYYYAGLRLLDQTADAYILIPQKWEARRDRVFIVPRADTIRIDLDATHNN